MTIWVALLRGINVGGRRLAMADLRDLFRAAGHDDVRTYVQSGNVVFHADATAAAETALAADLSRRIGEHCGYEVPVMLRTGEQLAATIEHCPYPTGGDPTRLVVSFAPRPVEPADVEGALPSAGPGEDLTFIGRDLYLWLPDGQGRSPLVQALAKRPAGREFTARNWRTVTTLAEWSAA